MFFYLRRYRIGASLVGMLFLAWPSGADVIPAGRRVPWIPGQTVGLMETIGPHDNIINMHTMQGMDKTGVTNCSATAIQTLMDTIRSYNLLYGSNRWQIYWPAGHYRLNSTININADDLMMKGDGIGSTFLNMVGNGAVVSVGGAEQTTTTYALVNTNAALQGVTNLTVVLGCTGGAQGCIAVGDLVAIGASVSFNDDLHVFTTGDGGFATRGISSTHYVQSITGSNIVFAPPIPRNYTNNPYFVKITRVADWQIGGSGPAARVVLDGISFTHTNPPTGHTGTSPDMFKVKWARNFLMTNCEVYFPNQHIGLIEGSVVGGLITRCVFRDGQGFGSGTGGLRFSGNAMILENNIFANTITTGLEIDGGFGNAIFANYFTNAGYPILMHAYHPWMNLCEANIFLTTVNHDGYFGSSSHWTYFRNHFTGKGGDGVNYIALMLNRFQRQMNVVGNVMGSSGGTPFKYEMSATNRTTPVIFAFGSPNIGNPASSGVVMDANTSWNYPGSYYFDNASSGVPQPYTPYTFTNNQGPTNVLWGDFSGFAVNPYPSVVRVVFQSAVNTNFYYTGAAGAIVAPRIITSSKVTLDTAVTVTNGSKMFITGASGYQQIHELDKATHLITGNFDYAHKSVYWDDKGPQELPVSFLYTEGPPSWWGSNRWPATDPLSNPMITTIPAQQRHLGIPVGNGDEIAPVLSPAFAAVPVAFDHADVTWSSATDNVRVSGYRLERSQGAGSASFSVIGTTPTTTFDDSGLAGSTVYNYRLQAFDTAGNASPYSTVVTITTPAAPPDTTPPASPVSSALVGGSTQINVTWNASADNVAVVGYRIERSVGLGSSAFIEVATSTALTFADLSLVPNTAYNYRVRAFDAAGNVSDYSVVVSATTSALPDETVPTVPQNVTATVVAIDRINISWTASSDNGVVAGYRVERSQGSGSPSFSQVAATTGNFLSDTGLVAGTTYNYRVRAFDAAGNLSDYSAVAFATTGIATPASGLVAAYGFNEPLGITAVDGSGNNNSGAISGAARTDLGKFGRALAFNGVDNLVTVNSSFSLNFTSAMTLEAWVNPSSLRPTWAAILHRDPDTSYLHASSPDGSMRPASGGIFGSGEQYVAGPNAVPLNQWTHLASTYDGTTLRLYVNGIEVASRPMSGLVKSSTLPLRIGGNTYPDQFFDGLIDEVRIYRRALTPSEIGTDMNTPVVNAVAKPAAPAPPRITLQ